MIAKSYLYISTRFEAAELSMNQAAHKLSDILIQLGGQDEIFLKPILKIGENKNIQLDFQNSITDSVNKLAEGILEE